MTKEHGSKEHVSNIDTLIRGLVIKFENKKKTEMNP